MQFGGWSRATELQGWLSCHGMLGLALGLLVCIFGGGMKLPRERTHVSDEFFRRAVLLCNQVRFAFSAGGHAV